MSTSWRPARKASKPKVRATTNKGQAVQQTPQKGEQFCGPHLTQLGRATPPTGNPPPSPDPYANRSDLGPTFGEIISSPFSDTLPSAGTTTPDRGAGMMA